MLLCFIPYVRDFPVLLFFENNNKLSFGKSPEIMNYKQVKRSYKDLAITDFESKHYSWKSFNTQLTKFAGILKMSQQDRTRGPRKVTKQVQNSGKQYEVIKDEVNEVEQRKELIKKEIIEVCQTMKLNGLTNISDVPEIPTLCQLLRELTVACKLNLDEEQKNDVDLKCLLSLLVKHRHACYNTLTCLDVLTHLCDVSAESPTPGVSHLEILLELSRYHLTKTDFEKSKECAEKLKELAIKLGNIKMEGEAYSLLFDNSIKKQNIDVAQQYLEQYKKCSEESGDGSSKCRATLNTAYVAFSLGKFEDALSISEEARQIAIGLGDKKMQCDALAFQGTIQCGLFNIQKSFELESKVVQIAKEIQYNKRMMQVQVNQASTYSLIGEYLRSYKLYKKLVAQFSNSEDKDLAFTVLCNLSVCALMVDQDDESLQCARKSLVIAEQLGTANTLALAHGNIGLALEKKKDYLDALVSYEQCLKYGKELKDDRIINNGYCNLGRAHKGIGNIQKAEELFTKAYDAQEPLSAHWCDTQDFRFSADYLLGTVAFAENNLPKAKCFFEEVVKRCDKLRRNITESKQKICFNDTQKKPYQYLQYILVQEGMEKDALMFGEKGRGRDFYDRVVQDENTAGLLKTVSDLIEVVENEAVLVLSQLDVVGKMCCWFIMPDSEVKVFLLESDHWSKVLSDLDHAMYKLQMLAPRESVEMRGVDTCWGEDKEDEEGVLGVNIGGCVTEHGGGVRHSGDGTRCDGDNEEMGGSCGIRFDGYEDRICVNGDVSGSDEIRCSHIEDRSGIADGDSDVVRSGDNRVLHSQKVNEEFATVIDNLSELVVRPVEDLLEQLINNKSTTTAKPKLLIIPQSKTFNIPYAALKFKNGEPLCSGLAIHETISFHAYNYHNVRAKPDTVPESSCTTSRLEQILIVGNPTTTSVENNKMSNLPFAQEEAEFIGQLLGVKPLTQSEATHTEVVRRLPTARVVHFACHGSPQGKWLFLAPSDNNNGYLTMEEVSQMVLQADLVVLSACHTARGAVTNEGIIGLARAFHIAGAKCVITALWAIPDKATKFFMQSFYKSLLDGTPIVHALSATMDNLRKQEPYTQVTSWGSFKVLGSNIKVTFA